MRTIATLSQMTGVAVVADWPADCEIPVLSGVQRQGDVTVVPRPVTATTPVLAAGVPVVRGESGPGVPLGGLRGAWVTEGGE